MPNAHGLDTSMGQRALQRMAALEEVTGTSHATAGTGVTVKNPLTSHGGRGALRPTVVIVVARGNGVVWEDRPLRAANGDVNIKASAASVPFAVYFG